MLLYSIAFTVVWLLTLQIMIKSAPKPTSGSRPNIMFVHTVYTIAVIDPDSQLRYPDPTHSVAR